MVAREINKQRGIPSAGISREKLKMSFSLDRELPWWPGLYLFFRCHQRYNQGSRFSTATESFFFLKRGRTGFDRIA